MPVDFAASLDPDFASDFMDRLNTALGSAAYITFFDGTMPANCEAGDAGTALIDIDLPDPVFAGLSGNDFFMNAVTPDTVVVSGTCQYFRIRGVGGATIIQGGCTETTGQAITFNDVDWTNGQTVGLISFQVTCSVEGSP